MSRLSVPDVNIAISYNSILTVCHFKWTVCFLWEINYLNKPPDGGEYTG